MPLKREDYTRPHGRRYPADVQKILTEYLDMLSEDSDKNEDVIKYRSEINPKTSHNRQRKHAAMHIARKLSVEMMPEFLAVAELTPKKFLELILESNSDKVPFGEDWKELAWPDPEGALIADFLDAADAEEVEAVRNLVGTLHPNYFADFCKKLQEPSGEYGKEDCLIPIYAAENKDYVPETKAENLSDRLVCTLDYLTAQSSEGNAQVMEKFFLYYNESRTFHPRHFWGVFNVRQIDKICESLKLSPHWVFYGNIDQGQTILAKNPETEYIMDMYYLLPSDRRKLLNNLVESYHKGR